MRIHIENDANGPDALQLPTELLHQRLELHPQLRNHFTLTDRKSVV